MTAATIVLASLAVLVGAFTALLAWRDVHPAPAEPRETEALAKLLAQRYRPTPRESVPAEQAFEWSGPGETLAVAAEQPDAVAALVKHLGAIGLDAYARDPKERERLRGEIAKLIEQRA